MKELLARSLDRHMRRAGITQTSLAKRSGIVKTTLNTYFTRKSFPSQEKLQALAEALSVTVEDLLPDADSVELHGLAQDKPDDETVPLYSVAAIPGRPGRSKVVIRADLPTDLAMRIMALAVEAAAKGES